MTRNTHRKRYGLTILLFSIFWTCEQARAETNDVLALIRQGTAALAQNKLQEAAQAFQKAIDLDPSSAKAHEELGVALSRALLSGAVRPSADSDVFVRAEEHLRQASDLAPSAPRPLMELSALEAAIAERSADEPERSGRYNRAIDLLKRAVALEPGKADLYLRLANLERDEFGPVLQQAKARFGKIHGPIPDPGLRHALQQRYGSLIDEAIANAKQASEMNAAPTSSLLLTSRLLRQRALIRDTQAQYATDMHSADDWQRQFLAVGGHLQESEGRLTQ
ncbi:MAG TPA: tetratricopeptide repeat protein [Bryobacteraceae bacterium]